MTSERMVAAIWTGHKFELCETRRHHENSTVVRVLGSGLCGTDRHLMEAPQSEGRSLGHEIYAEIVHLGANLNSIGGARLQPGDRIIATPGVPCMKCHICTTYSGHEQLCEHRRSHGFSKFSSGGFFPAGGFSNYIELVDNLWVLKVDPDITLPEIMFTDLLPIALKAMERGLGGGRPEFELGPGVGLRVAVLGLGPIGAAAVFVARSLGAEVLGVDVSAWKVEQIQGIFAIPAVAIPGNPGEALEEVRGCSDAEFDLIVDCTGDPRGLELAVKLAKKGGRIVEVGSFVPGSVSRINPSDICRKELEIVGSLMAPALSYNKVVRLIRANRHYDLSRLTTHHVPLGRINDVLEIFATDRYIKIHIEPVL